MTDKTPKWVTDAAREIDKQYATWMSEITGRANRLDTIEAIIKKHCPDDKGAGGLLEACKEFVRKVECGEAQSKRSYAQMRAAIAEYEANK